MNNIAKRMLERNKRVWSANCEQCSPFLMQENEHEEDIMPENRTHRLTPERFEDDGVSVIHHVDKKAFTIHYDKAPDIVTLVQTEAANFRDILNDALPSPKMVEMERILRDLREQLLLCDPTNPMGGLASNRFCGDIDAVLSGEES